MKAKRFLSVIFSVVLIMSIFHTASAQNSESIEKSMTVLPYGQMKYVRSTGIISGISPETPLEDVLSCFENSQNIKVYNDGAQMSNGNVATGWQFKNEKTSEVATVVICGDINKDSEINLLDLLKANLYCADFEQLDDFQKNAMDVNRDGSQDIKDCLMMRKHLADWFDLRNSSLYYVSKNGSDNNEGSEEYPFLTVGKAASVMTAGDTCLIKEGTYRETIIPANDGEEGAPVTFMAYGNDNVTISGTEKVIGNWELYKDGIYKTNFYIWRRTENQIFVNGKMAQIARYPNKNSDNMIAVGDTLSADSASDGFIADTELIQEDGFFEGARISTEGTSHYIHFTSTVTNYSKGSVYFDKLDSGWDSPTTDSNYYFYDSLNLLDAENEWYYDGDGTLYYKPQENITPDQLTIEYSVRPDAFDVRDKAYITIKGLEIFGANVRTNKESNNLNLDSNKILYYYHTMASRVYPWEAEWYGVELWGKNSIVQNCEIAYGAEGGVEIYADNCSVVNNYIHDINYINSNAAAIEPKYANYTLISHNTIENIARSAIVLACKNMRVCYNKISNCAVNTHDVSGIGSYKFDAEGTVEVDHNVIFDCANDHSFVAYYLDNGSMNYLVHHNVCYNVDLSMILNNPSYGNRIYNNTFLSTKSIQTGNMQNPFENNAFIGAVWDGDQFYNNIMPSLYYGTGAYYSNNLLSTNSALKLNEDLTLQEGSIAIDKGISLPVGTDEYKGNSIDIGAYEYGAIPWSAGQNSLTDNNIEFSLTQQKSDFTPVSDKPFLEMKNAGGTQLITNYDFENSTDGWGGFNYTNTNSNASTGEYAIEIDNGWIERTFDVQAGQTYIYSGDIMVGEFGTTTEFGVHFMDNNYNIKQQGAFMVTATAYNTFETVFTIPEGCAKMRVFVASWAADKKVYCDNVKCLLIS